METFQEYTEHVIKSLKSNWIRYADDERFSDYLDDVMYSLKINDSDRETFLQQIIREIREEGWEATKPITDNNNLSIISSI